MSPMEERNRADSETLPAWLLAASSEGGPSGYPTTENYAETDESVDRFYAELEGELTRYLNSSASTQDGRELAPQGYYQSQLSAESGFVENWLCEVPQPAGAAQALRGERRWAEPGLVPAPLRLRTSMLPGPEDHDIAASSATPSHFSSPDTITSEYLRNFQTHAQPFLYPEAQGLFPITSDGETFISPFDRPRTHSPAISIEAETPARGYESQSLEQQQEYERYLFSDSNANVSQDFQYSVDDITLGQYDPLPPTSTDSTNKIYNHSSYIQTSEGGEALSWEDMLALLESPRQP